MIAGTETVSYHLIIPSNDHILIFPQLTGVLHTFLGVIVAHPDVQKRAYDEILSVVGKDGLPGLQHRTSLPYIDCIIQEVHRYYPAVPLITHSNNKEDNYKGFHIPKKSWVMANVWCVKGLTPIT